LATLAAGVLALAWIGFERWTNPPRHFNAKDYPLSLNLDNLGLTLIPESERPLDRVVLGIDRISDSYFLLPKVEFRDGMNPKQLEMVREMMYWVDLELSHGHMWNLFPADSVLYIGVPVRSDNGQSSSRERKWFEEYLRTRWTWNQDQIRRRIRFFDTPDVVIWGQDIGEVMGRDREDRTVISLGKGEPDWYRGAVLNLVKDYPSEFALAETSPPVSTEGGDLELVWGTDRRPMILAGRFAAIRYFQRTRGSFPITQKAAIGDVLEAKRAF
jgi:hypothetical protein